MKGVRSGQCVDRGAEAGHLVVESFEFLAVPSGDALDLAIELMQVMR